LHTSKATCKEIGRRVLRSKKYVKKERTLISAAGVSYSATNSSNLLADNHILVLIAMKAQRQL
jgi:hypothetical protein